MGMLMLMLCSDDAGDGSVTNTGAGSLCQAW